MPELTAEEQLTRDAYDQQAARWSSAHMNYDFWADEIARFNEFLPSGKLLEIGAGGGRDAHVLVGLGYDYLGTDISGGLVEEARKNNPGVTFVEKSVYDLDYDSEFDGFWCSAVLLHVPRNRIGEALEPIHRAMAPGAIGFISVKQGTGEHLEVDDKHTGNNKRLFVYWQGEDFRQVLEENNFEVLEEGYKPMSERTRWLTYMVKAAQSRSPN